MSSHTDTDRTSAGAQAVDLTNCDREPIHIIGQVQPFGMLMAVSADWIVAHASANIGDLLGRGLSIMALAVICRQAWRKAAEAMEFGDATNMRGLPLWPFYGAILAGMGLCALVYLVQVAALLAGHDLDGPDTPEAPTAPEAGTDPETGVPAAKAHAFRDAPDATPAAPGRPAPADPKAPNTPTGKEQTR